MVQAKPTIIELDMDKLEDVLHRAKGKLDEEDFAMVKALADAYAYLTEVVGDKNTSIARLRKLLFGAKTEKTARVLRDEPPGSTPSRRPPANCPFGSVRRGDRPWRSARRQGIAAGYRDPAAERIFPER